MQFSDSSMFVKEISDRRKNKRVVKPIRNKKQSAGSNFKLAKTPLNTWGGLSSIPQNYTKMKKISKG